MGKTPKIVANVRKSVQSSNPRLRKISCLRVSNVTPLFPVRVMDEFLSPLGKRVVKADIPARIDGYPYSPSPKAITAQLNTCRIKWLVE